MSIIDKIGRADGYLLAASYGLASSAQLVWLHRPHVESDSDPGYWRPVVPTLATIPAALLSVTAVVVSTVKLVFQMVAKGALCAASLLGSVKAGELADSIQVLLTTRKTALFFMGAVMHILAVPLSLVFIGSLSHWLNMQMIETFAEMEVSRYLKQKIAGQVEMEITVDDVEDLASKVFVPEGTGMLCVYGFANHAIRSAAENMGYTIEESHLKDQAYRLCQIRKFSPYFTSGEKLCECGLADADHPTLAIHQWEGKHQGTSKYTWKLIKAADA